MVGVAAAARVARETWLETGLSVLADRGDAALTVEFLCAAVGRSKGSFYHHFTSTEAFAEALLEHWRQTRTESAIRDIVALREPWARRLEMDRIAAGLDSALEQAIRKWAASNNNVRVVLREVDRRRIACLARVIQDVADVDDGKAADLAQIEYAALVGVQQLFPNLGAGDRERLLQTLTDLVTPGGKHL